MGSLLDPQPAGLDDSRASQRDHGLGRREGQLGEHPGGLSRLVLLLVGDQGDRLLLEPAVFRAFFSRDPERQLALVFSFLLIGDDGAQQVRSAGEPREARRDGLLRRGHVFPGGNLLFLQPRAFFLDPALPDTEELEGPALHELAIDVGDNRLDLQRLSFIDEGLLAAEPDIEVRRMYQDRR